MNIRKTLVSLFCFILLSKPHKVAKECKEHKEYKHTRYDRHKGNIFKRKHFYILHMSDWVIWKIARIFSTASEGRLGCVRGREGTQRMVEAQGLCSSHTDDIKRAWKVMKHVHRAAGKTYCSKVPMNDVFDMNMQMSKMKKSLYTSQ